MIHFVLWLGLNGSAFARDVVCDAGLDDTTTFMVGSPRPKQDPVFTPAPDPDLAPIDPTPNIPDQEPYIDPAPAPLPEPGPTPEPLERPPTNPLPRPD